MNAKLAAARASIKQIDAAGKAILHYFERFMGPGLPLISLALLTPPQTAGYTPA
jgi:hypothetical protein